MTTTRNLRLRALHALSIVIALCCGERAFAQVGELDGVTMRVVEDVSGLDAAIIELGEVAAPPAAVAGDDDRVAGDKGEQAANAEPRDTAPAAGTDEPDDRDTSDESDEPPPE